MSANIGVHFEIPVRDMKRAIDCYQKIFNVQLTPHKMDGYDMAFFPYSDNSYGTSGALVIGDIYRPSIEGILIYLHSDDIDATLRTVESMGLNVLLTKISLGEHGFCAEFQDTEGNRIGLHQPPKN